MTETNSTINTNSILDQMYAKDRVIITANLTLDNGHFLQPTGFPDIGSCTYTDGEGKSRCLIESEQSMANRLESVCLKAPGHWVDDLSELPVIEVQDQNGGLLATNLTEPHRVASSYVLESKARVGNSDKDMKTILMEKLDLTDGGDSWALNKRRKLDQTIFALDPAALIHGFQFVQWKFVGLRQTRLVSGRLECELNEKPDVDYGMVKFDLIEPGAQGERSNKGQSIAAKNRIVPARDSIQATFDIDVLSIKNLALDEDAKDKRQQGQRDDHQKKFLLGLALWKIGAFLSNKSAFDARSRQTSPSLRLRTDCYLSCGNVKWRGTSKANEDDPEVKPDDLMKALPPKPKFEDLIRNNVGLEPYNVKSQEPEKQPEQVAPEPDKENSLIYKVTYTRKPTARPGTQAPPPADTQTNQGT